MVIKKQRIVFAYILTELILLNLSYFLFLYFRQPDVASWFTSIWPTYQQSFGSVVILLNLSWGLVIAFNESREIYFSHNFFKGISYLGLNILSFLGLFSFLLLICAVSIVDGYLILGPALLFSISSSLVFWVVARKFENGPGEQEFGQNMLILGAGKAGQEVLDFSIKNRHLGYGVLGFVDGEAGSGTSKNGISLLGNFQDLGEILDSKPVHELVITLPRENEQQIKAAIEEANYRGIRISMIHEKPAWMGQNFKEYRLGDLRISQLRQTPLDDFKKFVLKKAFDMVFAFVVIVLLSPVFLLIGLLVVIDSGFPVFYLPVRKREAGLTFRCFKFRSMKVSDDPNLGTKSTVKNDPRLTRIGKFMRKYDLDELPQFFNVLKGEMSVVGPRPHRIHLKQDFRNVVQEYMVRTYVKPGITGWAQVNGWRGPTVTPEQKEERIKHDLWYIENWSFFLDLKIIFLTVFGRKARKNAF